MTPASAAFRARWARPRLIAMAADGRLVVPVATFALDAAPEALAVLQSGHPGGKLALLKFGLEAVADVLAAEVAPFGITVMVVGGAFRTNLFGPGAAVLSTENPVYAETAGATRRFVEGGDGTQPGDPAKAAAAIRAALADENTPLRLPLGGDAVGAGEAAARSARTS